MNIYLYLLEANTDYDAWKSINVNVNQSRWLSLQSHRTSLTFHLLFVPHSTSAANMLKPLGSSCFIGQPNAMTDISLLHVASLYRSLFIFLFIDITLLQPCVVCTEPGMLDGCTALKPLWVTASWEIYLAYWGCNFFSQRNWLHWQQKLVAVNCCYMLICNLQCSTMRWRWQCRSMFTSCKKNTTRKLKKMFRKIS